jgi:hypothetical protein
LGLWPDPLFFAVTHQLDRTRRDLAEATLAIQSVLARAP